jgi:hypothetical protein
MHLSLLLLRLFEHLLDNLLLLNQERADDTVLDTSCASRSTIGSLHSLLWARDGGVFAWSEGWDTLELDTAVTACDSTLAIVLYSVQFEFLGVHFGAVPFFLMWRYLSFPPGVLIMRTRLEEVLYDCRRRWKGRVLVFQGLP